MPDVLSQAQIVPILGSYGEFETITGGDAEGNYQEYWPAGARFPRMINYTGKWTDVTLTRAYIPGRDNQLKEWWTRKHAGVDPLPRTLVKQFRNAVACVQTRRLTRRIETYP